MNIKLLLISFYMMISLGAASQTASGSSKFFAQGMFPTEDPTLIETVEADLRALPFVDVVRLDHYSGRFFLLSSTSLSSLSESELRSWFGSMSKKINCIQIGIHGIDTVETFPFESCKEN